MVWTFLLHRRGEGRAEAEGRPGFSIYSRPRGFRLLGRIQQTVDKAGSWGLLRVFREVLLLLNVQGRLQRRFPLWNSYPVDGGEEGGVNETRTRTL